MKDTANSFGWPTIEAKRAYEKQWRAANRDKVRAYARKHYVANKENIYRKTRRWALDNPEKVRQYYRTRANLPEPTRDYPEACELCGKKPTGKKGLMLDHCHDTGVFRGWLCVGCNFALGHFRDDCELLLKAVEYLRRVKK